MHKKWRFAVMDIYTEETVSWQYKFWASSSLRKALGEERNDDVRFFEELLKDIKHAQKELEGESEALDESSGRGTERRVRYLKQVLNQCMKVQRGEAYESPSECESKSDSDSS